MTPVNAVFALLWVHGAACAIGAAAQAKYHRLAALIMVGGAGLITCLTFAWFSAPDLALTQLAVEVVTTVLLLLGLRWMPRQIQLNELRRKSLRARARRARDLTLAVLVGAGVATLAFAIMTRPAVEVLAPFFIAHALPDAGGRNVVNVIIVDFRAFDTLGEITVLGTVALTVYALLRRFRPAPESRDASSCAAGGCRARGTYFRRRLARRVPAAPGNDRSRAAASRRPRVRVFPAARP